MTIIEVRDLRKSYSGRPVVQGIDLDVAEGEVLGILGPNGAGKTTTVEMIGGLRRRDGGEVRVAGHDPADESPALREILGIQLQESRQPAKITVRESLDLFRSFYRAPRPTAELLTRFGLESQAGTRFEHLSGGQQQRLSVALALAGNPRVAILDELTTGLDPAARREIWDFLLDLKRDGVTIILVTHSMEEAQFLCDRVAIIDAGAVTALDTPSGLAHSEGLSIITFLTDRDTPLDGLRDLPCVVEVTTTGGWVTVHGTAGSPAEVLAHLTTTGTRFEGLQITAPTLDDAYLSLTRKPDLAPAPTTTSKEATR